MIAALLVALLAQTTPQRDARPAPAAATGTISGIVTSADAQPRPLRRVRVQVGAPALPLPRSIITGDDGAFRFDGLPAGQYSVVAVKDGYLPTDAGGGRPPRSSSPVPLAAGQSLRLSIAMPRGAVVTGTVTDVDGSPAQGITVTALQRRFVGAQGEYRYFPAGVPTGTTDDRGIYRIYALPEGEYVISAQPQTRFSSVPGMDVRRMAGANVDPRPLVMTQIFHPGATTVASATRIKVRAGEERGGVDVPLQYVPLATVSGTLAVTSGLNRATLTMVRSDEVPGFDPPRNARPDAEGRFTISSVPPGQYRIVARSAATGPEGIEPNRQVAFADVTVEGEDVSVALGAQPGLSITGELVFKGDTPPQIAPAAVLRSQALAVLNIANTGYLLPPVELDGMRFKIDGIIPGTYRTAPNLRGIRAPVGTWWLQSVAAGDRDLLDAPLDIRQSLSNVVITFADRASELSGAVTDAQGAATADGWVVAFPTHRAGWFFNSRRVAGLRVDRTGRYTIRNLPPGDYYVVATRDLEQGEWFDPAALERLAPLAKPVTIAGVEKTTADLTVR